jgi:Protein of unknown function (DUF2721)
MIMNGLLVNELSRVISEATAPAFLLGAVAAFVSVLVGRLNQIVDRSLALSVIDSDVPTKMDGQIQHLKRRARLMSKAIEFAVVAGISTTFLVIVAFGSAALGLTHAYGAAALFVVALGFFAAALICLWLEIRIAVGGLDGFL